MRPSVRQRRSFDYADLFVDGNSGAENSVCTFARGGMRTTACVAAGDLSNVQLRLREFEDTHVNSIKMRIDGAVFQPGAIGLITKLTEKETAASEIWTLLTLPTLRKQFVVATPLGPLDHRLSGRMFADALGHTLGDTV